MGQKGKNKTDCSKCKKWVDIWNWKEIGATCFVLGNSKPIAANVTIAMDVANVLMSVTRKTRKRRPRRQKNKCVWKALLICLNMWINYPVLMVNGMKKN